MKKMKRRLVFVLCVFPFVVHAQDVQQKGGGNLISNWLKMDSNSDGKIDKNEASRQLKTNFDRIDSDGDGYLDC
jgi:hypothetical protein